MRQANFTEIVKEAFNKHGVDNPQLENAISDILNIALDTRNFSKQLYREITEHQDRDQRIKDKFR
ncbi:hypothetical protein ACLIBH_07595 [Virgibacillus sp. W0430]|uniref:hypothetical protein n=1 Tax=Virgibacillus sp. W0430 TaxID=3391580 RepID=UPI003F48CE2D